MPHRVNALPHPAILAHRGASRYAPENTLAAFQLAVEQHADGVELDVRLSADGHLIVIHDASVRHTTNGKGWVASLTLAELRKLEAGFPPSPAWASFPRQFIPTLDEVFETLGDRLLINVELKPLIRQAKILAEKVAQAVQRHQLQNVVICSSFSPPVLSALAQYAPEIPRGLLLPAGYLPSRLMALAGRKLTYETLHPDYHDILRGSFPLSAQARANRPGVFAYTVNDEGDMKALFSAGIDGIFTDDPPLARRVRGF